MEEKVSQGRLYFSIVETAVGSKSQGWHGILYGKDGAPIALAAGEKVDPFEATGGLPFTHFIGVAANLPWHPYGAIPESLMDGSHVPNNVEMKWWLYQIWVVAEGTRSAATSGILVQDGKVVEPTPAQTITTAMGEFAWHDNNSPYGSHGWYPKNRR